MNAKKNLWDSDSDEEGPLNTKYYSNMTDKPRQSGGAAPVSSVKSLSALKHEKADELVIRDNYIGNLNDTDLYQISELTKTKSYTDEKVLDVKGVQKHEAILDYKQLYFDERSKRLELEVKISKLEAQLKSVLMLNESPSNSELKSVSVTLPTEANNHWSDMIEKEKERKLRARSQKNSIRLKSINSQNLVSSKSSTDPSEEINTTKLIAGEQIHVEDSIQDVPALKSSSIRTVRSRTSRDSKQARSLLRRPLISGAESQNKDLKDNRNQEFLIKSDQNNSTTKKMPFQDGNWDDSSNDSDWDESQSDDLDDSEDKRMNVPFEDTKINDKLENMIEESVVIWATSRSNIIHMLLTVGEVYHGNLPEYGAQWVSGNVSLSDVSEIRKMYLKIAKYCHPDKISLHSSKLVQIEAKKVFAAVTDYYNIYKSKFDG